MTGSPGMPQIRTPVNEEFFIRLFDQALDYVQPIVERRTVLVDLGLTTLVVQHLGLDQRIDVPPTSGALLGDLLIHQRLRAARLVRLFVTPTAVADQVAEDVAP